MTMKHWMVVAGLLTALGLQIAASQHWADLLTPTSVGGMLVQIAATLGGLFANPPQDHV